MALTVLIASYLEEEHVARVRKCLPDIEVLYDTSLLPPPRYVADHHGRPDFRRTPDQEARFRSWLARADVLFDFDFQFTTHLDELAPRLRWIQATSSGIGPYLRATGIDQTAIRVTNAAGIHAVPLAEHVLLAMLYFCKEIPLRLQEQSAHLWNRYCGRQLRGQTVGVIGVGAVGKEVARTARTNGLRVLGLKRNTAIAPVDLSCDELFAPADLHRMLPRCQFLVLICPHTPETEGLIGASELNLLPRGAVLINIARGAVLQEEALLAALRSGHLGGAALDVVAAEPLSPDSPLWDAPNVLITAHSASTVDRENEALTDLFCENLRRFAEGRPLVNLFQG